MAKPKEGDPEPKPQAVNAGDTALPVEVTVSVHTKKHEGSSQPYKLFIDIDGEPALQLMAYHFERAGQMERFAKFIEDRGGIE